MGSGAGPRVAAVSAAAAAGEVEVASTKDLRTRSWVRSRTLRVPYTRLDRPADASPDAPLIPARRNCWFTLVASGGVGVKSAAALSPLSLR